MAEGNHPSTSTRAQESSLSFRSDDHGAVGCGCNICFEIPKDPVTPGVNNNRGGTRETNLWENSYPN
ncbi:hypothetical protein ACS0TY_028624 [Phlomoides rotata]